MGAFSAVFLFVISLGLIVFGVALLILGLALMLWDDEKINTLSRLINVIATDLFENIGKLFVGMFSAVFLLVISVGLMVFGIALMILAGGLSF